MKVTKVQKAFEILTFYCHHCVNSVSTSLEKPYDWPQPCEHANSLRRQDHRPLSRKAAVNEGSPHHKLISLINEQKTQESL